MIQNYQSCDTYHGVVPNMFFGRTDISSLTSVQDCSFSTFKTKSKYFNGF